MDSFWRDLEPPMLTLGCIDPTTRNQRIWFPKSNHNRTSSVVYDFLNCSNNFIVPRMGWKKFWTLNVAPREKYFIWLIVRGRVKTY